MNSSQHKKVDPSRKEATIQRETFQTPKGVHDILPDMHDYFTYIKKVVRHRLRQAGFRRISTPMFEFTEVFARSLGDASDIVQKEMYTFPDRKGRSLTLKPEGTAGVVRAYIQHAMHMWPQPVQFYYIEPHFRYDRPQKGRFRQFHQFGFEIIGEKDPALDAQCIQLAHIIHQDLGIADRLTLQINSIGCPECRTAYHNDLKNFYIGKERSLCANCKERLHTNPLRLLDCKEEDCQILSQLAPKFETALCQTCKEYHESVLSYVDELGLRYAKNPQLVRGLDYYTNTVFEFWDEKEGAQNSVGGGGRYDGLAELMGGQKTPAVGYAGGIERLIDHMKTKDVKVPVKDDLHIFVAQLGNEAKKKCLPLIMELRNRGVKTMGALGKGSMKAQLSLADKFKAPYTLILGITEVRDGTIIIRDMKKGKQEIVPMDEVVERVIAKLGEDSLDHYHPGEILY